MKETVLGEIYNALTPIEVKSLDKYLKNSNWRQSETIVRCHDYFYNLWRQTEIEKGSKSELYEYIYPQEEFVDTRLRFTQNRLLKAIQEWKLVQENEHENPFAIKIWKDFLIEKQLRKNIQLNISKAISIDTSSDIRFLSHFFDAQENSFFEFKFKKNYKEQFKTIIEVMNQSEYFADLVFIKNYCSLISFSKIYKSESFELPIAKLNFIKEKYLKTSKIEFQVYLTLLEMLEYGNETHYYDFKRLLFENLDHWIDEEKLALINYLINYTIQKSNAGNAAFIDERFEIYKFIEAKGVFESNNFVSLRTINNVMLVAIRKKEMEWAQNFLTKYIKNLSEEEQDTCACFNYARIYFEQKKYKESLRELLKVDFSQDPFYATNAKLLLLKNYVVLNEFEAFESLCVSFKEFVKSNKIIAENYKSAYLNFIKYTRKIFNATKSQRKKLKEMIQENKSLVEKGWLLEICE